MKNTDEFPKINLLEKFDLSKIDWKALEESLKNFSYKKEEKNPVWWPEIFDTKDLTGICDAALCAYGLSAWGNCHAGFGVHPNFGEVMVMIGQRLGISPTGENLMKWSDEYMKKTKKTVFLGGTCNGSTWREKLIPMLGSSVEYFNPVVPNWTAECQSKEIEARNTSDVVLYVITPKMAGFYSIAEVVDDSNKRPGKTVLVVIEIDGQYSFTEFQKKSMVATANLVSKNGAKTFFTLEEAAEYLNQ